MNLIETSTGKELDDWLNKFGLYRYIEDDASFRQRGIEYLQKISPSYEGIKPCPFCNKAPNHYRDYNEGHRYSHLYRHLQRFVCGDCGVNFKMRIDEGFSEFVERWNKRAV